MSPRKPKVEARNSELSPIIDITVWDEKAIYLIGWPGYRNRLDRTGLDPFDTQNELAHMQGLFTRWLLTGKFRTHNPFYLLTMFIFGLFAISPLLFSLVSVILSHEWWTLQVVLLYSLHIAIGIAVLVNGVLSIIGWNTEEVLDYAYDHPELFKTIGLGLFEISPLILVLFIFFINGNRWEQSIIDNYLVQIAFGVILLIAVITNFIGAPT